MSLVDHPIWQGATRAKELSPRELLSSSLFKLQQDFVRDPSKLKTLLCSRRSGKTHVLTSDLIDTCLEYPDSICLYATGLTQKQMNLAMWRPMKTILSKTRLVDQVKINEGDMNVQFDNGSMFVVVTVPHEDAIDRARGPKYRKVCIDEAAFINPKVSTRLLDEVIMPALLDLDGSLYLAGTPSNHLAGPFFEATTKPELGYSRHHWTVAQNTTIPHAAVWVEQERKRKGWAMDTPAFRREYLGEWAYDSSSAVYKFDDSKNWFSDLPKETLGTRSWILGVDVGWEDATSLVLCCYDTESPNLWVVSAESHKHWLPSRTAERLKEFMAKFRFIKIVMDCGALGKSIAEDFRQKYHIPIEAAEKTDKLGHVEFLNDDLGGEPCKLRIHRSCDLLVEQMKLLQKDDTGKEDPRCANDLCDSLLYAHRYARSFLGRASDPKVPVTQAMLEEMFLASSLRRAKAEQKPEETMQDGLPELPQMMEDDQWGSPV